MADRTQADWKEIQRKLRSGEIKVVWPSPEEMEPLKFLKPLTEEVLALLGHPEAWISDKSMFYDFETMTDPGEVVDKADPEFLDQGVIVARIRDRFGVDVTPVYDKYLPEILHYIAANRTT